MVVYKSYISISTREIREFIFSYLKYELIIVPKVLINKFKIVDKMAYIILDNLVKEGILERYPYRHRIYHLQRKKRIMYKDLVKTKEPEEVKN